MGWSQKKKMMRSLPALRSSSIVSQVRCVLLGQCRPLRPMCVLLLLTERKVLYSRYFFIFFPDPFGNGRRSFTLPGRI